MNTVWKMICKISGKNQSTPLNYLIKNNTQVTNRKDIANTLAKTFSANSSSKNFNTEFHKYKKKEKQKFNFKSDNTENNGFCLLSELKEAIQNPTSLQSAQMKFTTNFSDNYLQNS